MSGNFAQIGPASLFPAPTPADDCKLTAPAPMPPGYRFAGGLIIPVGTKRELRMRRMPYKSGKPVELRIVVDIQVKSALNLKLWQTLKLPSGWRKAPRRSWKNDMNFPVRIYTYQPLSLSAEELTGIQAQIALMEMV